MRRTAAGGFALLTILAACGKRDEAPTGNIAAFVPPAVLSRLDFGSEVERRFRALDRNGNDAIDATELPSSNARWLTSLDRDGNGQISQIEFSEGMLARFDRADVNHDGTVTSQERELARSQRRQQRAQPQAAQGG